MDNEFEKAMGTIINMTKDEMQEYIEVVIDKRDKWNEEE